MWNLRQESSPMFWGVMLTLLALAVGLPSAQGQNVTGYDAVYNSSGNITASPSFIDASVTQQLNQTDLCATVYSIFKGTRGNPPYPATGAVVDARGISGATALTCAAGTTPWNNGTTTVSVPSTILLPATGGATPTPIIISTPWILPANTHLIGEGDGLPSSGSAPGTTIQAKNGFSGSMIQFGSPSCPPVNNVPTQS